MTDKKDPEFKLVFAIVHSGIYSWMLEPYAVQIMKKGMFAYNHVRVSSSTLVNYVKSCSDAELTVLQLLDECRNEVLARVLGLNKWRSLEFAREVQHNSKLRFRVIRYLRQKTDLAISILADNTIPIYFKGDPQDIINEQPIIPQIDKLDVCFNFSLIQGKIEYTITTSLKGEKVQLTENNTIILNYEPCWLIMDNKFIQVSHQVDGKKIQPFLSKDKVLIEASQVENYLQKFVRQILCCYPFTLEGMGHQFYEGNPTPVLTIETSLQGETVLSLSFKYGQVDFRYQSEEQSHVKLSRTSEGFLFHIVRRDIEFENGVCKWLADNGLVHVSGSHFRTIDAHLNPVPLQANMSTYSIVNFVNENTSLLHSNGFNIDQMSGRDYFIGNIELRQKYTEERDWFDLKIFVHFDNIVLPFSALKKNILENIRELVLPDGRIAILPSEWFSKFHDLAIIGKQDGDGVRVKKSQFRYIENILEGNERIERFIESAGKGDFPVEEQPEGMLKSLRPYQLRGMSWFNFLHQHDFGGCLSDDMGLGKTIQVLAFLWSMKLKQAVSKEGAQLNLFGEAPTTALGNNTSLIVMPLSLVHNWENEIRQTVPGLKTTSYIGLNRHFSPKLFETYDLVLTTYGTVRNDIEKLKQFNFRFVFLDESQYIKNPESKIFAAVSKLNAGQRFVMTGTPVENSLIDLWSQLQFVNPGLLGDLKFFRDRFYQPIQKKGSKSSEKRFRQIINPFILRRTKAEVAKELPELTEKIHYCPMTASQSEIYERRKSEIRNYILESTQRLGAEKAYMIILSGLMRLRLLANHPLITEKEYEGDSGKFEQVTQSIRKVIEGGHKLLIFSQFVKHLNLYGSWLEDNNIPYLMLTGQTPAMQRENMIKKFQKGYEFPIFLISLKAGGVGLNLTAADFVFLLDPWWNPAVEQQAINRTHRIGQNKKVISYKFISENTIEEKIIALQQKKMHLFNNIVNYKMLQNVSSEELVSLIE